MNPRFWVYLAVFILKFISLFTHTLEGYADGLLLGIILLLMLDDCFDYKEAKK